MSLFPFFGDIKEESLKEDKPLYKEIAWDYKENKPLVEDGDFKQVTGAEAVKTWCYKTLQTNRYKFEIYTWSYGNELENLIGKQYTNSFAQAECTRYVEECLLVNPYIESIESIATNFIDGLLKINCTLKTAYGEVDINV